LTKRFGSTVPAPTTSSQRTRWANPLDRTLTESGFSCAIDTDHNLRIVIDADVNRSLQAGFAVNLVQPVAITAHVQAIQWQDSLKAH